MKSVGEPDLACGPQVADPWSTHIQQLPLQLPRYAEIFYRIRNLVPREALCMLYCQDKSTDSDKLTANKLTAKRRFRYSIFVTDLVAVISSQREGLGEMALGIVKMYLGSVYDF